MKRNHTVISAVLLQQKHSWRSTLLLLLLCMTIVWPASLQSLFQSLAPVEFFAGHVVAANDARDGSLAVAEYGWTPDHSDNQSALTQTSQVAALFAMRSSDHNARRGVDAKLHEGSSSPDAHTSSSIHDISDSASNFFSENALTAHPTELVLSLRLAKANTPWVFPTHLPSHRGLVRFALAPPTFC